MARARPAPTFRASHGATTAGQTPMSTSGTRGRSASPGWTADGCAVYLCDRDLGEGTECVGEFGEAGEEDQGEVVVVEHGFEVHACAERFSFACDDRDGCFAVRGERLDACFQLGQQLDGHAVACIWTAERERRDRALEF